MIDNSLKDSFIPAREEAGLELAAFANAHPVVELVFFSQVADARSGLGRKVPDVIIENGGLTARGRQQTEQHSNRRGFAGTIAADQGKNAAARHFQIQFVNRGLSAEIARQTPCADSGMVTDRKSVV